jgi:glycosyltransferase involved in cell wall biosynthesis
MTDRTAKKRLLIVGDCAAPTGFARVVECVAAELRAAWSIAVLAINYLGDPHPLQQHYRLYPAHLAGDQIGAGRLASLIAFERPDAILIVQDAWNIARYTEALDIARAQGLDVPPIVADVPVDAASMRPIDVEPLNACAHVAAYTEFGRHELRAAGLATPCHVIPHGIDLTLFRPIPQAEARAAAGMAPDAFAVLSLDRNAPRKRLDIAFDAFAQFAADKPANVRLVYHGALRDVGWDIESMAEDLDIADRLVLTTKDAHDEQWRGVGMSVLPYIYSMCDVKLSTTSGEGWGLTTMEAMACGLPNIVPQFGALAEWASATFALPAMTRMRHTEINTVGRVPTTADAASALEHVYRHPEVAAMLREKALEQVACPAYRWPVIAAQFDRLLTAAAAVRP